MKEDSKETWRMGLFEKGKETSLEVGVGWLCILGSGRMEGEKDRAPSTKASNRCIRESGKGDCGMGGGRRWTRMASVFMRVCG